MAKALRALTATLLSLVLVLTGCIASQGPAKQLSASEGQGDLVVYMVLSHGELERSEAWWSDQAPELDIHVATHVPGWRVLVLKNDVQVERVPVVGSEDRAFVVWRSSASAVGTNPGDDFEFLVVNGTMDQTVASFGVQIGP